MMKCRNLDIGQFVPLRNDVELDSTEEGWQGGGSDEQYQQDHIGEYGSHIHKLRNM